MIADHCTNRVCSDQRRNNALSQYRLQPTFFYKQCSDFQHALKSEVRYTDPITYKLKDLNGEEIKGSFYEQELQKTTQEMFRIEKVIRRKGDKSLVKWMGYSEEFNSWVDNKDLVKL